MGENTLPLDAEQKNQAQINGDENKRNERVGATPQEKPADDSVPLTEFKEVQNKLWEANRNVDTLKNKLLVAEKKNELSVPANEIQTEYFNPAVWTQMKGMAETFQKSGALPADMNAQKIVMLMQAGSEMGMKPIESIKSFYFVKGTLNIFGAALAKRLRDHGWKIKYTDEPNKCTVVVSKGDETYEDTLTFEEAEKSKWTAGQHGLKPGWYEGVNRRLKLRYGVLSIVIKTYLPEVLGSATDVAEVAIDMAPVIAGELEPATPKVQVEGGDDPADEEVIKNLKTMIATLPDENKPEIDFGTLTKSEAATAMKNITVLIASQKKGGKK